jgi:hypothetical protein
MPTAKPKKCVKPRISSINHLILMNLWKELKNNYMDRFRY